MSAATMSAGQPGGLDFHPGLRVAFVEYCKVTVGQGRLTYDPNTPKLSQSQFIKLLQDVAVCEPDGPVALSTVTIIFASFKPLGGSRMLFPHFFRALGALGVEANMDVLRLVANLGSRTADLQYLTSIKVFPDKAYPYILTKGGTGAADEIGVGTDGTDAKRSVWTAQPPQPTAALQATHIGRYASQPFAGQGVVAPGQGNKSGAGAPRWASARDGHAPDAPSPRTSAHKELLQQVLRGSGNTQGGHGASDRAPGPDSPNNIGVVVYHVGLNGDAAATSPGRQPHVGTAPPMLPRSGNMFEDMSAHPPNHQHMEQWGLYDPSRTHEQNLPALVNYLLKRLDKLEGAVDRDQADKQRSSDFVTHDDLSERLAPLEAQIRLVQAACDSLEVLSAQQASTAAQGLLASAAAKYDALADQVSDLNQKVDTIQSSVDQTAASLDASKTESDKVLRQLQDELHTSVSQVVETVEGVTHKLGSVASEAIPSLEGGITELAKQVVELQGLVEEQQAHNRELEAQLSKSVKAVVDQTAVDRTQLQTTSDLVGQAYTSIEELKNQLAVLDVSGSSAPDTSELQSKVEAMQKQVKQVIKDLHTSDKELTARMDQLQLDSADSHELVGLIKGLRDEFTSRMEHAEQQQVASLEHTSTDMQALRDELSEYKVEVSKEVKQATGLHKEVTKRVDKVEKGLAAAAAAAAEPGDPAEVLELLQTARQELMERIEQVAKQQPDNSDVLELVQASRKEVMDRVDKLEASQPDNSDVIELVQAGHQDVLLKVEQLTAKQISQQGELLELVKELREELEGRIEKSVGDVNKKTSKQEKQLADCLKRLEALDAAHKEQGLQAETVSRSVPVMDGALDELNAFKQEALDRLSRVEEQLSTVDAAALAETISAVHEELLATQGRMTNARAEVEEQIRELEQQVYSQPSPSSGPSSEVLEQHVREVKQQVKSVEEDANTKITSTMDKLQALQDQIKKNQDESEEQAKEHKSNTNSMLEQLMASFETLRPDLDSASKEITEVKKEMKTLSDQLQHSKASSKDVAASEEAVKRLEDLAVRVDVAHDNLKDMRSVIDELSTQIEEHTYSIASAIRAHRQSEIRNNEESLTERAAVSAEQAAEAAEAAFDLASALEDKMNLLNRLVRATNAAMTSLEATQLDATQRLAALEAKAGSVQAESNSGQAPAGVQSSTSLSSATADEMERVLVKTTDELMIRVGDLESQFQDMALKVKHGVSSKSATHDQLTASAVTPEAWVAAQQNLETLASKIGDMQKAAQAAQEAADEVMKIKVSFQGLQDLLDEHSDQLVALQNSDANLLMAIGQLRGTDLSEKMKLLNVQGMDETVASQAELSALTTKVQSMEDTLVATLGRIDTSIAQAALQSWQTGAALLQRSNTMQWNSSSTGAVGRQAESARLHPTASTGGDPGKYITAVDGNIAGGATVSPLKTLNPNRDKLAAAILETDQRVTGIDEMVRTLKAGQDTQKQRIKELAEALVSLSNKAQSRFTKLESMRREDPSEESSKSGKLNAAGVSPALKNLDQASSQLTGMHRLLAKRIDEMEERLTKAEAKGRSTRTDSVGLPPPSAAPPSALEEDVKGIGQDIVALHSMIQRTEADLRQAIAQECVSREEVLALQQSLETRVAQKEDLIIKLAAQMDAINRQLK